MADLQFIERLEALIRSRMRDAPDGSYTAHLVSKGIVAAAQKVGEEGVEVALAVTAQADTDVVAESADLLYHLLVVLGMRGIDFARIVEELEARHRQ
jgi:phosphoribosyl-ATP pyrophosphohydrolase/phosphoribosyl-AMP cyclohydrolase